LSLTFHAKGCKQDHLRITPRKHIAGLSDDILELKSVRVARKLFLFEPVGWIQIPIRYVCSETERAPSRADRNFKSIGSRLGWTLTSIEKKTGRSIYRTSSEITSQATREAVCVPNHAIPRTPTPTWAIAPKSLNDSACKGKSTCATSPRKATDEVLLRGAIGRPLCWTAQRQP